MKAFYNHMLQLLVSIEDCRSRQHILPCLVLLYSGIDVMASLERAGPDVEKKDFQRSVTSYLLAGHSFDCTADDLYAARCGIVHTFSAESRLSRDRKAKPVVYAWGDGKVESLMKVSTDIMREKYRFVHLDELIFGISRRNSAIFGRDRRRPEPNAKGDSKFR